MKMSLETSHWSDMKAQAITTESKLGIKVRNSEEIISTASKIRPVGLKGNVSIQ